MRSPLRRANASAQFEQKEIRTVSCAYLLTRLDTPLWCFGALVHRLVFSGGVAQPTRAARSIEAIVLRIVRFLFFLGRGINPSRAGICRAD